MNFFTRQPVMVCIRGIIEEKIIQLCLENIIKNAGIVNSYIGQDVYKSA
jgi:hypothetical protein